MLHTSQEIPVNNKLPSLQSNDKRKTIKMSFIHFVSEDSQRRKIFKENHLRVSCKGPKELINVNKSVYEASCSS